MYVTPGSDPPWPFWLSSPQARPMVELAWLYGPIAPMPEFILTSWRIGPLTMAMAEVELVDDPRAVTPVEARARTTGRYSGRQPAMTALTATFSTVTSQNSRNLAGRKC